MAFRFVISFTPSYCSTQRKVANRTVKSTAVWRWLTFSILAIWLRLYTLDICLKRALKLITWESQQFWRTQTYFEISWYRMIKGAYMNKRSHFYAKVVEVNGIKPLHKSVNSLGDDTGKTWNAYVNCNPTTISYRSPWPVRHEHFASHIQINSSQCHSYYISNWVDAVHWYMDWRNSD